MSNEQATLTDDWGDASGGEYPERECPMCGGPYKSLPSHLRYDCEATDE